MKTKYGYIAILIEDRKKKIDWKSCKFIYPEITNFFNFCNDYELIKSIVGY
jgi:hypothetical protein